MPLWVGTPSQPCSYPAGTAMVLNLPAQVLGEAGKRVAGWG
jgi:hypothetical protein